MFNVYLIVGWAVFDKQLGRQDGCIKHYFLSLNNTVRNKKHSNTNGISKKN